MASRTLIQLLEGAIKNAEDIRPNLTPRQRATFIADFIEEDIKMRLGEALFAAAFPNIREVS